MTHGIEATCASPNGIEAKCASPRWRPNPEIDWHRDRYLRDMINPAGRNHVNRQRSPSSNAIMSCKKTRKYFSVHIHFNNNMQCLKLAQRNVAYYFLVAVNWSCSFLLGFYSSLSCNKARKYACFVFYFSE